MGPHSDLFAVCERSLSDEQRAVVVRWAVGDFRADDEQLTAAEVVVEHGSAGAVSADSACPCCQQPDVIRLSCPRLMRQRP